MKTEPTNFILIVEDNPDHALIIEREFQKHAPQLQIECAENGEKCLEKLAEKNYAAVVLDYSLPQMNGLDVLTRIATDCFDVPVIMISGQGNETVAVSAIKGGAFDYIVKGSDYASRLISTVLSAVEKHKLHSRLVEKEKELELASDAISGRDEELQSLDQLKHAMLSTMIHTLRSPLVSIRGYTELILGGQLGPVTAEQKNGMNISLRNVDKLLGYIDDYLSFISSDSGDYTVTQELSLNQLLEDAVTTILPHAIGKRIKISLDNLPSHYRLSGDERRLSHALVSLLDAAIHGMNPDDIIKLRIHETGGENIIVGIHSSSPVTPLNQLAEAECKWVDQELVHAEEIIRFHHGELKYDKDSSTLNWTVTLPLTAIQEIEAEDQTRPAEGDDQKGTILIVDDDRDCLDLLSMILSRDYHTIAVKTGSRMFEVLDERRVDMVLLDINMYDINGIDACRRMKSDPSWAHVPVYMISATLGEDKKQLSLEAGASGFIEKPFEMETILGFIGRVFPQKSNGLNALQQLR